MFSVSAILSTLMLAAIPSPQDATLLFVTSPGCAPCREVAPLIREIAESGYSVEVIDASEHPELVRDQLKVRQFPTFLMLSNDRIVDRVEGVASAVVMKPRLLRMFENAAQANKQAPMASAVNALPAPPALEAVPLPKIASAATTVPASFEVPRVGVPRAGVPVENAFVAPSADPWITSSVKLRVDADNGHSWGTGTIVDTRNGEALILTCGHIFRDWQEKNGIEVHLFGENSSVRVFGKHLFHDLEIDLALIAIIPPCPVRAIPIAPAGYRIQPRQQVLSVGCDHGSNPTVRNHQILSTDRIGTPRTNAFPFHYIQVSGAPVSGRSGGGLFAEEGYLIGVCNTADPESDDGHFVPPEVIRHVLKERRLADVYENPSLTDRNPVARPQIPAGVPTEPTSVAVEPATGSNTTALLPLQKQAPRRSPVDEALSRPPVMEPETLDSLNLVEQATLEEIRRRTQDGDEVILIIRSRRNPEIPCEIITLSGTTPQFVEALARHNAQPIPARDSSILLSSHGEEQTLLPSAPDSSPLGSGHQPVSFPVRHD